MPTLKKKAGPMSEPQFYQVKVPGNYGGVLADPGAMINIVNGAKQEQLIRLHYVEPINDKQIKPVKCGRCGVPFVNEYFRDRHGDKRHSQKTGPIIKDFDQCTQAEKDQILANTMRYETSPYDLNVPDPSDREISAIDREAQANIDFSKTAASRK